MVIWLLPLVLFSSVTRQTYGVLCCMIPPRYEGCRRDRNASSPYSRDLCRLLETKCRVECLRRRKQETTETKIANVIHQMWKTSSVPSLFEYCVSTMLRMHMRWHYVFWGDKDISALFASRAPQIGRNFNNYGLTGLQTSDVARYLIVYVYGGFYVDLDMEAIKPLDPLLDSSQLILGQEPRAHGFFLYGGRKRVACNAIIGSEHSFKFWEIVLNNVKLVGGADAVSTTGPLRLDAIVSQYGFDSYVKEPRLFYPLVGPTAYSKVLQYCDKSAGATWAQRMYHARIMDPCFDYIDEAGHFPNRLTNYSYTAHHWSHTNLNPPECDDNKKKGAMTNTVDIARILRRATWIEVGNPHRRPISENPLDQLITCASTTPPEMRRQYHHHH